MGNVDLAARMRNPAEPGWDGVSREQRKEVGGG